MQKAKKAKSKHSTCGGRRSSRRRTTKAGGPVLRSLFNSGIWPALCFRVDKSNGWGCDIIKISGSDKQEVGMIASKIKSFRPPEPYKGKGIKEQGQYILRKEGKKK